LAKLHIDAVRQHCDRRLEETTFYEFGAGWEMTIPLAFYAAGVEHQIVVDIRNLLRPMLVNNTIEKYQRMASDSVFLRIPERHVDGRRHQFQTKLKECYGIDYRAPCDAKLTGIETNSIDVITSTSTLEHIPFRSLQLILRECHRILRDDGLVSFIIDYTDHYSYFDSSISRYNYLKYSDAQWALFNNGLHFQNRLRHCDYLDLFRAAGFEVVDEQHPEATDTEMKAIARLPLAKKFECYALHELAVSFSLTLIRKAKHLDREIADTTVDDTLVSEQRGAQ